MYTYKKQLYTSERIEKIDVLSIN